MATDQLIAGEAVIRQPRSITPHDGPLLEQSLKAIAGRLVRLPRSK